MDIKDYNYKGTEKLVYQNNSHDTLRRVYFHLYNNAFQPGSEMDARLQAISDPDGRMVTKEKIDGKEIKKSRINALLPSEIGFLKVTNLMQDGVAAKSNVSGTILEVTLAKAILPNAKTTFTMNFNGQVPVQIRRSGRNNAEGVEFSMSQWYPKMAEFDFEGWHADPYIAREFFGVWGNFDVNITLDKDYVLGGTGYLQNPNEIGHGYQDKGKTVVYPKNSDKLTWHFKAPMVHDFTWAADKKYNHDIYDGPNGVKLHFLYLDNPKYNENWKGLQPKTAELMDFYNKTVGNYPYKQYSVIQAGDGGMEYAMCTLILGNGEFDGLLGVTAHEMAHSWFQHVLGSNESKHYWMDEGFTTYLEDLGMDHIAEKKVENPYAGSYRGYYSLVNSGKEQPQTIHADRFDANRAYSISAYSKGEIFLSQMEYLIGKGNVLKTLKRYFRDFKFKHPTPNDVTRSAERVSGAELNWYLNEWTETTNTIDYGIKSVDDQNGKTFVTLERIGRTPMPIDLMVDYSDGTKEYFYIPLTLMHFQKPNPYPETKRTVLPEWDWGHQTYGFLVQNSKQNIAKVTIDPSGLMADIKQDNNILPPKEK